MNETAEPFVSVCIPTFNGMRYLDECLKSIRSQTFKNVEILIVDDHSADGTISIAREHAWHDERIRIERNRRRLGLVQNWNRCVDLARGDWIKFVFQDDRLEEGCLQYMLEASNGMKTPFVVCRREILFDGVGDELPSEFARYLTTESLDAIFPNQDWISAQNFAGAVLDHFGVNFIGEPTAALLHRSVFDRWGPFSPDLIDICDFEYWIRIGIHVGLVYVPETLATFRVHQDGTSLRNRRERWYRRQFVDPLILLHEMVFHPAFAPLRSAAAARSPRLDLRGQFARLALSAATQAKRGETDLDNAVDRVREWRAVSARYPNIRWSLPVLSLRFRRAAVRRVRSRHGRLSPEDSRRS